MGRGALNIGASLLYRKQTAVGGFTQLPDCMKEVRLPAERVGPAEGGGSRPAADGRQDEGVETASPGGVVACKGWW